MIRVLALTVVAFALAGCVERKLFIRTDPPGAEVALNRAEPLAGTTPLETPFTHYGVYHLRLTREGFPDFEGEAPVTAPWWAYPPFDLFTDLLWPFTIHDHREILVALPPRPEPRELDEVRARHAAVIERGESMRRHFGGEAPPESR
ncbi:MAG: PEGA domain-containing protein [Planctomycetes bacterium]|jgi:hypothetical protein|nr:PEGA domain-containing protein [Planctomycetota bacterium]